MLRFAAFAYPVERGRSSRLLPMRKALLSVVMSRKRWLAVTAFVAACATVALSAVGERGMAYGRNMPLGYAAVQETPARRASPLVEPLLIDLEERTFRFFWDTANPKNGLVPDRYPTPGFSSIAAVGFGLTSYPIGVERGYVTRKEARKRVLATLRFLWNAPQGPHQHGMAGYKGFFYHFLDMKTGERYDDSELSTVDTALLIAGALFCQSYFDGALPEEVEIRRLADALYRRVDWHWAQPHAPAINLGWSPEDGFLEYDWRGYNEAMLVYVLALGSPTFPVGADAWAEWTSTYDGSWHTRFGQEYLGFAPLFGHQYSHVWLDFRNLQDAYMRRRGIDYFENSRRATYAQRAYAIANPLQCKDYGATMWGITASDGPGNFEVEDTFGERVFRAYSARGIGGVAAHDDCTLAPTAAVASIPFAPEIAIPAVLSMYRQFGQYIYGTYGFLDAFNPTFAFTGVRLDTGRYIPGFGWVAEDYLGIDQGALVAMVENYRSGLIWSVMRENRYVRDGLTRAGFSGGWLAASVQ
jgi:hypothetical protein